MRMSFIARYVYSYKKFVIVIEAPECNRMTATGQDTDNKLIIYKYIKWQEHNIQYRQLCVYMSDMFKFEMNK